MRTCILYLLACIPVFAGVPVILDTDLGDDIDDTWALAYLLGNKKVDVKLIVTASDDTPTKARLVAKILEGMHRTDIPIGIGKKTSDEPIHQAAWLGDYQLKQYPGTVYEDGVQALIDTVQSSKRAMKICVIGPQTNLAEAVKRAPAIAQKSKLVCMAGSVYVGYQGKSSPDPEWNVFKDIASARAVFASPWDITIAPLDICGKLILKGERYQDIVKSKSPRARTVIANYDAWSNCKNYPAGESSVLFDTAAAYLVASQRFAIVKTINLSIDDKGATVPDPTRGRPVHCALSWQDRERFEEILVKTIR